MIQVQHSELWRLVIFVFKQKTAYDLESRDWSSDVYSSDLEKAIKLSLQNSFMHNTDEHYFDVRQAQDRPEERRVGKECVSTCISRRRP